MCSQENTNKLEKVKIALYNMFSAALHVFNNIFECGTLCHTHEALGRLANTDGRMWDLFILVDNNVHECLHYFHHDKKANLNTNTVAQQGHRTPVGV